MTEPPHDPELQRLRQDLADSRALIQVISEINSSLDLARVLQTGLEGIRRVCHSDYGGVVLILPDGTLELAHQVALPTSLRAGLQGLASDSKNAPALPTENSLYVLAALGQRVNEILRGDDVGFISVPLSARGKAIGVLFVETSRMKVLAPPNVNLLMSIGEQIGMAIENARLHAVVQNSEEWHRTFIETSFDGFWEGDFEGKILYVNDAAREIFGYTREELLEMRSSALTVEEPADRVARLEELGRIGFLRNRQVRVRTKTGAIKTLDYSARVVRDGTGNPMRFQAVFRDVTEQQQKADTLAQRAQELSALNAIGKILNNPLTIQPALNQVCEQITSIMGMESVLIWLIDPAHQYIRVVAHHGVSEQVARDADWVSLDEPSARLVAVEGKSFALNDIPAHPELGLNILRAENYWAGIAVPIRRGGVAVGMVGVGSKVVSTFHESDVNLMESIGNQIGSALENAELFGDLQERVRELDVLARFSGEMATTLDPEKIADRAAQAAKELLRSDTSVIRLREGNVSRLIATRRYREDVPLETEMPLNAIFLSVMEERLPFLINDLETETRLSPEQRARMIRYGIRATLSVPLVARRGALGVMSAGRISAHPWSQREIDLLQTLANHTADAIANARLFQEVSREQSKVQAILDSGFSGLYATDHEGQFFLFNRAAEGTTGWKEEEVRGKTWEEIFGAPEPNAPASLIRQAVTQKESLRELEGRRLRVRDGKSIPVAEAAAPLFDEQGNVIGAVGAFWDLSREQAAARTRDFFLSTIAHELGSGLTKILLSLEVLNNPDLPPSRHAEMWSLLKSAARGLKETSEFLMRKEGAGSAPPPVKSERFALIPLVTQVVKEFSLSEEGKRLQVHAPKGEVNVVADRYRVETILRNLIENALKYSPRSAMVEVTIQLVSDKRVKITVQDQGPGIPPKERPQVVKPFYRGAASRYVDGHGLGLAIAKRYTEDIGGTLRIGGRVGKGAVVHLTLRRTV